MLTATTALLYAALYLAAVLCCTDPLALRRPLPRKAR